MFARGVSTRQMLARIMKWVSIGVLLLAAMSSCSTADYRFPLELMICMGAIVVFRQALLPVAGRALSKEYIK
jgi:hypothetical protein